MGYLQTVLDRVNQLLPDELLMCNNEKEPDDETPQPPSPEKPKKPISEKRRKRQMIITGGYTSAIVKGDLGSESQPGDGFYVGFDMLRGENFFFLLGVDFFRNSAGNEYFLPIVGQIADPGEYIQGFRGHAGLGYHVVKTEKLSISPMANLRLLIASAIDGELSSIGNVTVEKSPVHLNLGTYLSYGAFSIHTSYEVGLSPVFSISNEEMKYRMWNLGLGVKF